MAREQLGAASSASTELARIADLTNANCADMAQATIKGRAAGAGTGDPTDLTGPQVGDIVSPAWSTYTPVVRQPTTSITLSASTGRYIQIGKLVVVQAWVTISGTGNVNSVFTIDLPVTASSSGNIFIPPGNGLFFDSSANNFYTMTACFETGFAKVKFLATQAPVTGSNFMGATATVFTAALANADQIGFNATYEVA